jgi:hypothetical protein
MRKPTSPPARAPNGWGRLHRAGEGCTELKIKFATCPIARRFGRYRRGFAPVAVRIIAAIGTAVE